jgi:hypothetical protein
VNARLKSAADLLRASQSQCEAGFLSVGGRTVDHAGFGRLVESGSNSPQSSRGVFALAGAKQRQIILFQGVQPRFDAAILQLLAGAIAHPAFG